MTLRVAEHVEAAMGAFGTNGAPAFVGMAYGLHMPHFTFDTAGARAEALKAIEALPDPDMLLILRRADIRAKLIMAHYVLWDSGQAVPIGFVAGQPPYVFQLFNQAQILFQSICDSRTPPRRLALPTPSVN